MAKLSTFIIMMIVFVMIFAGTFGTLLSSINDNYDVQGYNKTKIDVYDKLEAINNQSEEIKNKSMELQSKSGVLDVLGGFFESAYDTVKISVSSFSVFNDMSDQAFEDVNIANSHIYKTGITTIVIIAVFLGIIIALVVKRDT